MTALPLQTPALRLATHQVPESLRLLFARAGLAELPTVVHDLQLDADHVRDGEKVLLTFHAAPSDVNLFLLLSPALQRTRPVRYEHIDEFRHSGEDRPAWRLVDDAFVQEPEHPWWCPEAQGPGRRYAYSTDDFDFVEVLIQDLTGTVFIRAIN